MNKNIVLLLIAFLIFPYFAYSITTFIMNETEKISLAPNAIDPDNDNLTITYSSPLNQNGEWQTAYGDAGEYKTTITVSDGITNVSKDVLIVVNKKEEIPKIDSFSPRQDALSIKEGESINFKVSASDIDKDQLFYQWLFDDKKVKEGQEFEYDAAYDDSGTHKVLVEISDGAAKVNKEWVVDVEDVDRVPIFEQIGNKVISENQTLKIILSAVDPDGDNVTYSVDKLPEGATLEGNVFTWIPSFDTVKKEDLIDRVVDKFSVLTKNFYIQFAASSKSTKIKDSENQRFSRSQKSKSFSRDFRDTENPKDFPVDKKVLQNIVVTVKDANRAPILEDIAPVTINEGEAFTITPNAYDLDGDKVSLAYSGFISTKAYKSKFGDAGKYSVKVTASDGMLETSKLVDVIINHINRQPIFEKINDRKASEGDELAILLNAHDPDGDEIKYLIDNPPKGSSIKGNVFLWTPDFDVANRKQTKKFELVFAASDNQTEARQIANIEIMNKNRLPRIINASKNVIARVNEPVLLFVKAVDDDGDELAYTWHFGLLDRYEATANHLRTFTSPGLKVVKVIVSDGSGSVKYIINVDVRKESFTATGFSLRNKAPRIIDASKNIVARVNEPMLMFVKAVDDDNDPLTYTWDFGAFDKYEATANHLRTFTEPGIKAVKVIVSDGHYQVVQPINVNVVG